MQLIPNKDLQDPNVCFICEESVEGDKVLDTERFAPFNPTYPLNGRKYICERCGTEIANRFGFESSDAVSQARAEADAARAELGNVRARTTELADHIRDFVSSPAALDPQASADALNAVFAQNDSAAASALDPSKLAKDSPPEDIVAKLPTDSQADVVNTSDPKSIEARIEPQTASGSDILDNPTVAAKVDTFDGNISANDSSAVVPPEFEAANQPVQRDQNNDVVGTDNPGDVTIKSDGTQEVDQASLEADKAKAEDSLKATVDPATDGSNSQPQVSDSAVADAKAGTVKGLNGEEIPANQVENRSYDEVFGGDSSVSATSAAAAKATDAGVDLSQVQGTGKDGKVTAPDVQAHIDSQDNAGK